MNETSLWNVTFTKETHTAITLQALIVNMNVEGTPVDVSNMAASLGNLGGKVALITGTLHLDIYFYILFSFLNRCITQ